MEPKQLGEYVKSVVDALAPLGNNVTTAGKQVFTYAVRQVYADAIESFICLGAGSLAMYGMYRLFEKFRKEDPENENPFIWIPFCITSLVFGLFFFIAFFESFCSIHQLIAPEWSAVKLITESLKAK